MLQESAQDRINEAVISAHLARYFELGPTEKLGMNYGVDFAVVGGRERDGSPLVALFTEAKQRDWKFGKGDGLRLSLWKVMMATLITATTGMDCLLAIEFDDGTIRWTNFRWRDKRVIMAGRQDRKGMPNDREPHCIFPWGVWTMVAKA